MAFIFFFPAGESFARLFASFHSSVLQNFRNGSKNIYFWKRLEKLTVSAELSF